MNKFFSLKELKSSKWLYIIWPYLALLVIHIIFVAQAQQPWGAMDEFIQLANTRYLFGANHWNMMGEAPYGHFGYAFLIMPAFWFFSDPGHIYKTIVIINAILASALYLPIYYIIRKLFSVEKKIATLISIITCLYPAFVVQSMAAWQDSVIFTFYATSVALFYYFLKKNSYISIILFSVSVGYLYMMHARSLPILIIVLVFLLFVARRKERLLKSILGISIIILFYFITKEVNQHIISLFWKQGLLDYSILEMFSRLTTWGGIKIFFVRVIGQLLYLIQATYGLFLFGLIYLLQYVWNNKRNLKDKKTQTLIYLFITSLGVFFASTLFNSVPNLQRADKFIYGRYNELFLAPFISLGLLSFYYKENKKWKYWLLVGILFFSTFLVYKNMLLPYVYSPSNIVGVIIWPLFFADTSIYIISSIALILILILANIFKRKYTYGLFVLFILFSINILAAYIGYSSINKDRFLARNLIQSIKELDSNNIYYVEGHACQNNKDLADFLIDFNKFNYYWHLPDKNFFVFDEQAKINPEYNYVIASQCWQPSDTLKAEIKEKDNLGIQAIWELQ